MPEHDLTKICQAIPCLGSDVSTQAQNILKGLTGEDATFDIGGGGNLPTLFPMTYSFYHNVITYINDRNGDFSHTVQYLLDGTVLSERPTVISADMNNKVLSTVTSGSSFNTSTFSDTLKYYIEPIPPAGDGVNVTLSNVPESLLQKNLVLMASWVTGGGYSGNTYVGDDPTVVAWTAPYSPDTYCDKMVLAIVPILSNTVSWHQSLYAYLQNLSTSKQPDSRIRFCAFLTDYPDSVSAQPGMPGNRVNANNSWTYRWPKSGSTPSSTGMLTFPAFTADLGVSVKLDDYTRLGGYYELSSDGNSDTLTLVNIPNPYSIWNHWNSCNINIIFH